MEKLLNIFFLVFFIIYCVQIIVAYEHVCDFNSAYPLTFKPKQKENGVKKCTLKPYVLDKVTIKCGSDTLKYKLDPPNCLNEVYDSYLFQNKENLTDFLVGASSVIPRNDPEKDLNDISLRIPPNLVPEKIIYCACINEKTIKVKKKSKPQPVSKVITNKGIVEIIIPTLKEKVLGCDFTDEESILFTKGFDHNTSNDDDDIVCQIKSKPDSLIGFKCPPNSVIKPHDCFINGYDKNRKTIELQNSIGLYELVLDHYYKVFYAKVPPTITKSYSFFCECISENKRFIAAFSESSEPLKIAKESITKSNGNFVNISLIIVFFYFLIFLSKL